MHPVCIKPRRGLSCAVFDGVVRRSNNARNDAVRRSPLQYALRSFLRIIRLHATNAERISQWSDVTESMVTMLSPFCGYNTALYPQNGDSIVTIDSVTSFHPMYTEIVQEEMSIWSVTYQQRVFKHYHSGKHFSKFYLQDGGKNQPQQNYVTVTLCIQYQRQKLNVCFSTCNTAHWWLKGS